MLICRVLDKGELKEEMKMKGFRITSEVADLLEAEIIFRMAKDPSLTLSLPQRPIKRDFMKASLRNLPKKLMKMLKMSSCKRHIDFDSPDLDSLPYGYRY